MLISSLRSAFESNRSPNLKASQFVTLFDRLFDFLSDLLQMTYAFTARLFDTLHGNLIGASSQRVAEALTFYNGDDPTFLQGRPIQ
jgi:hypothetical protein